MCEECGCDEVENKETIEVDKDLRDENDRIAGENKHTLLHKKVFPVNIMGSPGSGKTTLIESLTNYIEPSEISVIQGDLENDVDKRKLESQGIKTYQINTHSGCHLNAEMINDAIEDMNLKGKKYLFIENVGNLVCPAGVNLGHEFNIVISSTAEGADKPKKYPVIFNEANMVVISKTDMAELAGFNKEEYVNDLKTINPRMHIVETTKNDINSYKEIARVLQNKHKEWEKKAEHHH